MKNNIRKTFSLLALVFLASCSNAPGQNGGDKVDDSELAKFETLRDTFTNPISIPKANGSDLAADPFVFRYNGHYYMYSTGAQKKIRSYVSEDLINWEPTDDVGLGEGICLNGTISNYPNNVGDYPYAPEVIYSNGYFYMVTSISGNGHFIFRSEAPEGPFVRISENLGKSIDGSFFIDNDEEIYFYTAGGTSLTAYKLEDDFITFKDDGNAEFVQSLLNCSMGAWTEGPYLIEKDSSYYMTYTGNHYLSKDYRVDYAYCKADTDVSLPSSYERKDTILLSTESDYNGLGHSSTVIGPDLDSYYIVYHNLTGKGANRYLNISRLFFNGSDMIASGADKEEHVSPRLAEFSASSDQDLNKENGFLLSNTASDKTFSAEFNVTGTDEVIFSYENENNYASLSFDGTSISIFKTSNAKKETVKTYKLKKEYDTEVNHTFRINYKDTKLDLYFDGIALIDDLKVSLNGGKIGFKEKNSFDDIGFLAFSNVAQGSGDNEEYKEDVILANSYDEKLSILSQGSGLENVDKGTFKSEESRNVVLKNENDRATYRTYIKESGTYKLNLRIPYTSLGKEIGIRINDKKVKKVKISSEKDLVYRKGDVFLTIADLELNQGQANISLQNVGEEVAFSKMELKIVNEYNDDLEITFTQDADLEKIDLRNNPTLTNSGLKMNIEKFHTVCTKDTYENYEINATLKFNDADSSGYFGFMLDANNYSKDKYPEDAAYRSGNFDTNYQGLAIKVDSLGDGAINNVDYCVATPTYGGFGFTLNKGDVINLKVVKSNNKFTIYVDDKEVHSFNTNVTSLDGILGFISYKCDLELKDLSIYKK